MAGDLVLRIVPVIKAALIVIIIVVIIVFVIIRIIFCRVMVCVKVLFLVTTEVLDERALRVHASHLSGNASDSLNLTTKS